MENIILIIHVVIAVLLIGSVLLQRSEGGALGIGAGNDSLMSSRSAGNFLTKFTTIMAILFIATSISLTIIHKKTNPSGSIIDKIEKLEKQDNSPKIPTLTCVSLSTLPAAIRAMAYLRRTLFRKEMLAS